MSGFCMGCNPCDRKGGSMEPPLCTNGSAGYLMQLSVNTLEKWRNRSSVLYYLKPLRGRFWNSNHY